MLGSRRCHALSYIVYNFSIVPYSLMSSCRTRYDNRQRFGGKLEPKGLGRGGVYDMCSLEVALWLRRQQYYLSIQARTDRKAGRFLLPFYSIDFFDQHTLSVLISSDKTWGEKVWRIMSGCDKLCFVCERLIKSAS